jgi:hypothetical protein
MVGENGDADVPTPNKYFRYVTLKTNSSYYFKRNNFETES